MHEMQEFWEKELVREPAVEGLFYPENPVTLERTIARSISLAETDKGSPRGIIVPNASFEFISKHCARGYARAQGISPERIVLVASHREEDLNHFLLPRSTGFKTPMGVSQVDIPGMQLLLSSSTIGEIAETAHLQEHGIEIHLPWIQYLFPGVPIIPLLFNPQQSSSIVALGSALQALEIESGVANFYLASCNLTPALPKDLAAEMAGQVEDHLLGGKWKEILSVRGGIRGSMNGPASLLSYLLHRSCRIERLSRGNSLERDQNNTSVIEYAAFSFEAAIQPGG